MKNRKMATGLASVAVLSGVLMVCASSWLEAQVPGDSGRFLACSNGTLKGRYAAIGGGYIPLGPPPAPLAAYGEVDLFTFDGAGAFSFKHSESAGGNSQRVSSIGTYKVNDDCTGEVTVLLNTPPFKIGFDIVIADSAQGREIYAVGMSPSPGGVVTWAAKRIQ
jgi:hypothetical protein